MKSKATLRLVPLGLFILASLIITAVIVTAAIKHRLNVTQTTSRANAIAAKYTLCDDQILPLVNEVNVISDVAKNVLVASSRASHSKYLLVEANRLSRLTPPDCAQQQKLLTQILKSNGF